MWGSRDDDVETPQPVMQCHLMYLPEVGRLGYWYQVPEHREPVKRITHTKATTCPTQAKKGPQPSRYIFRYMLEFCNRLTPQGGISYSQTIIVDMRC